jgi:hypothetical protein
MLGSSMAKQREGIKTLTVELSDEVYAEFKAALAVFRKRSLSSYVHDWVLMQIENAKNRVSPEEFAAFVKDAEKEISSRSSRKKKERVVGLSVPEFSLHQEVGVPQPGAAARRPKRAAK